MKTTTTFDKMDEETNQICKPEVNPIIKFGIHDGEEERQREDCYKKREAELRRTKAMVAIAKTAAKVKKAPHRDVVCTPQKETSPPLTPFLPAMPTPPQTPNQGPTPPPSLSPSPTSTLNPTLPVFIAQPTVAVPLQSAPSHQPNPSPLPSPQPQLEEETRFAVTINEEIDIKVVEEPQKDLTEEERRKVGEIVQYLFHELVDDETTNGCCLNCSQLLWKTCGKTMNIACVTHDCKKCSNVQVQKKVTPALDKAISRGMGALKRIAFPLFPSVLRDIWVSTEFLLVWVSFILSLIQLTVTGNNAVFNILHLSLASIALVLANIDTVVQLSECWSCKQWHRVCKGHENKIGLAMCSHDQMESSYICCNICCNRSTRGGKAVLNARDAFDIVRVFLSEFILYPLTICGIFELILCKGWDRKNSTDEISLAVFVTSSISFVLFVYILRIAFVFILVVCTQRTRQKLIDKKLLNNKPLPYFSSTTLASQDRVYEEVVDRAAGKWFSEYFLIHMLLQMIIQILIIIAISGKFQYENRNYERDQTIHISSYLWFMLVLGYILPLCGQVSFFVVNFYWVREFFIKFYIQILSILSCPDATVLFFPKEAQPENNDNGEKEKSEELQCKWRQVMQHVNSIDPINSRALVLKNFKEMDNQSFFKYKLGFPFRSPMLIIMSIIYSALQLAFMISATQNTLEENTILAGGDWTIFYIFTIIMGSVANMYIFCVAYCWILMIPLILASLLMLAVYMIFFSFVVEFIMGGREQR